VSEYKAFDIKISGVDIRKELDILYNDQRTAHWVVYRRFDIEQPSDHFVELTQDGVQGPKYKYEDELIEARMSLVRPSSPNMEMPIPAALVQDIAVVFYLKHTVKPKTDDVIYDTLYQGLNKPATVPAPNQFLTKYNIIVVYPLRDASYGRIEYYMVYCKVANQ